MAEIDALKEQIGFLRDEIRNMFIFLMAVLTGATTVVYQVMIGSIAPVFLFLGGIAFVVAAFILGFITKRRKEIGVLIDKLKEMR